MADVQQVLDDVRALKADLTARFDSIDAVIEQLRSGQVDAATLDALAAEVSSAREQVAAVNPEDPSGDDPQAPPPSG